MFPTPQGAVKVYDVGTWFQPCAEFDQVGFLQGFHFLLHDPNPESMADARSEVSGLSAGPDACGATAR